MTFSWGGVVSQLRGYIPPRGGCKNITVRGSLMCDVLCWGNHKRTPGSRLKRLCGKLYFKKSKTTYTQKGNIKRLLGGPRQTL